MKQYKKSSRLSICVLLVMAAVMLWQTGCPAKADTAKTVKLGQTIQVTGKGDSYKSSDSSIAYVNSEGRVTGKKAGTATITITRGKKTVKQNVTVVPNGKKKSISVCADEIQIVKTQTVFTPENEGNVENGTTQSTSFYSFSTTITVKNVSKKAAKKVILTGTVEKEKLTAKFGSVAAGSTKKITLKGKTSVSEGTFQPATLQVYSGEMLSVYNYKKKSLKFQYGTEDKKAPVIRGFIEENSYNQSMPYQVVYSNDKNYNYFRYVQAEDDRDGKVKLTVDTSKVDFSKKGIYTITYTAEDKAGNKAKAKAKISVRVADSLDSMADTILKQITKPDWSDTKKARAIYNYTRGHVAYTGSSNKSSWENEAIRGIRYGTGDCFTYYAVARALLTRAGIPNIEVTRVQGHGHHWWNMVYVQNGFYHFDTCPRTAGGRFCLVTDAQLTAYSRGHGNSHIWAYKKIPKSATKKLSSVF